MKAYVLKLLACALAIGFILVAMVLGVDTFGLFDTRIIPSRLYPPNLRMTTSGDRIIKAIEIANLKEPLDIFFAGSSRVAFAFDPRSPLLAMLRSYNGGLNGSHSAEMGAVICYAIDHGPKIRRIVWNIDFEEFFRSLAPESDFAQSGFGGAWLATGYARHLFPYEALRKSVSALSSSLNGGFFPYVDRDGLYAHERLGLTQASIDFMLMPSLRNFYPSYVFQGLDRYKQFLEARLAALNATLARAKARGIDVDIVLMPVHVTRLEVYRIGGLMPMIESWKARLAQDLVAVAALAGAGKVRTFDFSQINVVALEDFPPPDSGEQTRFFFETLHSRPLVGDMIAARLLDRAPPVDVGEFGVPLEDAVAPERLARERMKLQAWEDAHPGLVAEITALVAAERVAKR
ncbi:MAG: hypothetical protein NVSMB26_11190 [Beijerinckiaceae bacterium]